MGEVCLVWFCGSLNPRKFPSFSRVAYEAGSLIWVMLISSKDDFSDATVYTVVVSWIRSK